MQNSAATSAMDSEIDNQYLVLNASNKQYVRLPVFSTKTTGVSFAFWLWSTGAGTVFDFGNGPGIETISMAKNTVNQLVVNVIGGAQGNGNSTNGQVVTFNLDGNWSHIFWICAICYMDSLC